MFFKNLNFRQNKSGFTLIELLLVVILIAVLAGALLTVINPAGLRSKSRDSQRIADLKKIQAALELYFADTRNYPIASTWEVVISSSALATALQPAYLSVVPSDPRGASATATPCTVPTENRYNYRTDAIGTIYMLTSIMEVPTTNNGRECHNTSNWALLGCGGSYATSDLCYGVENP